MTASGDFIPVEDQGLDQGPPNPTAFGIELTPKVQGILIALLGLLGAYLLYNYLVRPVQAQKAELETQVTQKQAQVQQQQAQLQQVAQLEADLATALDQRVGVYELLGDQRSLDTLLLDINQQIENSNAAIENVLQADFANTSEAQLTALGLNRQQITQVRNLYANDPVVQRLLYTSELFGFNPAQPAVVNDGAFGTELDGKLQRYSVDVNMQALYPQTLSILRNIERLEPLVIIRDFRQQPAEPPAGASEEDLQGISRLLQSQFTLDVLVPTADPTVPPPPPAPPEEVTPEGGEAPPAEAPPQ
ncbi:hypothetical protein [Pseudanabaena sp. FACHB-2040]|uniref:hypothetical protein n=1 Tax=Pseudanabaena sp. FACHB-2040 TaxID=2692859 RepID=UPI001682B386|nr:hypothetical protein [Pseudanabaena sp. FACHB-2040]MBD2260682.1 hypothetical protein [Pseudanabaena sp. FACHB-2040]